MAEDTESERMLAEDVMDLIMAAGAEEGGATINIGAAIDHLTLVIAWLASLAPEMDTRQRVRLFTLDLAKTLARLIEDARGDEDLKRLRDLCSFSRPQ